MTDGFRFTLYFLKMCFTKSDGIYSFAAYRLWRISRRFLNQK